MRMLNIYRSDVLYEDESEVDFGALFENMLSKAEIMVEGEETTKFKKYVKGKINDEDDEDNEEGAEDSEEDPDEEDEDDDEYLLKYESPFVKRILLPQEPRLYCLLYNGNTVEYDTNIELASSSMVSPALAEDSSIVNAAVAIQVQEIESVVTKELHSFTQKTLDERGVFMLETGAEAFVWIGKKV